MKLCFKLEDLDDPARTLIEELKINLEKPFSISKKPYEVSRLFVKPGMKWMVLEVIPVFPDFAPYGLVVVAMGWILGWSWMFIPAGLMFLSGFFHSRWAYALGLWLGLRKKGSKARLRILKQDKVLSWVLWGERKVGSG